MIKMPRGRGFGWFGYPGFMGYGFGRGNPYPFCRWFPWLPRWWWSGIYGPITPWTYNYWHPYYGTGYRYGVY
ncbi:hypothetical protein B6U81_00835 [Thermoplasmatales archaeon ex4484_30]|nr:MAG: hypothetical protein B6U81_00835 [Thermoplasmatales archaeon ex4484_30]